MKSILLIISLLISHALCAVDNYLDGLERSFAEAEDTIVDVYVTMPPEEVENLIKIVQVTSADVQNGNAMYLPDFKYEETKVVIKWNGKEKTYEGASFKTGGMYARSYDKVGYNIKLPKKFLGRKNIRLRPDATDRSHMRSKLCCDIANRIGLPSIQAIFSRLYMNGEFWGLYTLMDAIKPSWIKQTFQPEAEEVTTLFQCKEGGFNFGPKSYNRCENANDEFKDKSEFKFFVTRMNSCSSISDIEEFMDVNTFLKYIAMEWLIGSFDHFLIYGHNFYLYKRETDEKWILIEHDYDNTFGNGISKSLWSSKYKNQDGTSFNKNSDPVFYTFADWENNISILKILVYQNKERFKEIVKEVLVSAFNPTKLNEHINHIEEFLRPYIEEDSVKGKDGYLPGRVNKAGTKQPSSVEKFNNDIQNSLKYWINAKFDVACSSLKLNKNQILEEATQYVPKSFNYAYGKLTPEDLIELEKQKLKENLKEEYKTLKEFWYKKNKKNPRVSSNKDNEKPKKQKLSRE